MNVENERKPVLSLIPKLKRELASIVLEIFFQIHKYTNQMNMVKAFFMHLR